MTAPMQNARFRKLVGLFERVVLGARMSQAQLVAQRLLGRMQNHKGR